MALAPVVSLEILFNHLAVQVETNVAWQLVSLKNRHVRRIISGSHLASHLLAGKVKQDNHVDSTPRRKGSEDLFDVDLQTGLFTNLSGSRFFRALSRFDEAAGQTPIVDKRLTIALDENQTPIYGNQRGGNRLRIVPVNKIARIAGNTVSTADRERS